MSILNVAPLSTILTVTQLPTCAHVVVGPNQCSQTEENLLKDPHCILNQNM